MELESWFTIKRYPHIGKPITKKDYKWVKEYVENPEKIRTHSFLPLIHKSVVKRKFRANISHTQRNPTGKRKRVKGKPKVRDIFFASHLDAMIFSKYNTLLSTAYENHIAEKDFNNCIVAYRKIPIKKDSEKNKCNIDFAKTAFEFIAQNKTNDLSVIVADVTSFFDNLNHQTLKKLWSKVLKKPTLPKDHYNIYKALTNIKYVEGEQLFESYDKTMLVKCGVPNSALRTEIKRKKINCSKYFREKNAVSYCNKKDFLKNNLDLIISKNNKVGIPQGNQLSATLANIYMLYFDEEVYCKISSIGGFYQRYSDDLIIVCEQRHEDYALKLIREKIHSIVHLEIEPNKTKLFRFGKIAGVFQGNEVDEGSKVSNYNKTLEYLGFSFDGSRVLIKTSGFSKFYRSMKSSFKRSASLANHSKNPDERIFRSTLYKRFTHRGAKRKLIYQPSKDDTSKYNKTKEYYWGNYLSYVYKANELMRSINGQNSIRRQARKLWRNFYLIMKFHDKRLKKK